MSLHTALWMWVMLCLGVFVAGTLWDVKRRLDRTVDLLEGLDHDHGTTERD